MGLLGRAIFREVANSALFGTVLFTFVIFLQRVGRLFEILVRSSAPPQTVAHLFALAIPFTLSFTVPAGVLVGVLIALSRMSSDGEITAMRASGVPSRKVIFPVLLFAILAMLVTATASLWLTPYSTWKTYKILNQLVAAELTAEVQPRVFEEQFPNRILYIGDVIPGALTRWRNVFIADITPPEEQKKEDHDRGEGPFITVASDAIAVPDVARNAIQLSLQNGASYEVGKDVQEYYTTAAPKGDQILEATKPNEVHARGLHRDRHPAALSAGVPRPDLDRDCVIQARIELHQRLALPPACFLLALIGIPLGISSRKGGKSSAFVVTVALAFTYCMGLIAANGLAKQEKLPVGLAMWIPNAIFAVVGIILLLRLERPGRPGSRPLVHRQDRFRYGAAARKLLIVHGAGEAGAGRMASLLHAAGGRWIRAPKLRLLFRAAADQLRADDPRLHVFRAAERHREEPYRDVSRIHVPVFPDAAAHLRLGADQRVSGRADHVRQCSPSTTRSPPLRPAASACIDSAIPVLSIAFLLEWRAVRLRSLLRSRRESEARRNSERDQGPAGADVSCTRSGNGSSIRVPRMTRAFFITSIWIRRRC